MPQFKNQLFPRRRSTLVCLLDTLIERINQRDLQLASLIATQPLHRATGVKTPITREHEARAKALYAEGMPIIKIAQAIGISRTAASLLVHDKYPFSVSQQLNS